MFIEYKNIIELLSISKVKLPKEPEQEDIVKFVHFGKHYRLINP